MPKKNKSKLFDIKLFPMDLGRIVCTCLPLVFRLKKTTPEGQRYKEKLKGGAIIAANHTGFSDPLVVAVTFWYRRVFFLIAEVVMKGKIRSLLLKGMGGIKVERAITDIEAIKKSVNTLKQGRVLAVFPQGGIMRDSEVETIKSGAVLMALQAGVPIVPMHIFKRERWYKRKRIVIGETIYPSKLISGKIPSTADIKRITDILMDEMHKCSNGGK